MTSPHSPRAIPQTRRSFSRSSSNPFRISLIPNSEPQPIAVRHHRDFHIRSTASTSPFGSGTIAVRQNPDAHPMQRWNVLCRRYAIRKCRLKAHRFSPYWLREPSSLRKLENPMKRWLAAAILSLGSVANSQSPDFKARVVLQLPILQHPGLGGAGPDPLASLPIPAHLTNLPCGAPLSSLPPPAPKRRSEAKSFRSSTLRN